MVIGTAKILINTLLLYPFVTHWLYIPRFLGLNMNKPHKLLIDSRLAVFFFPVSNKTAPKVKKNAPISRGGQNKLFYHSVSRRGAKVGIFFETTKTASVIADGGGSLITLNIYTMKKKAGSLHHCTRQPNMKLTKPPFIDYDRISISLCLHRCRHTAPTAYS